MVLVAEASTRGSAQLLSGEELRAAHGCLGGQRWREPAGRAPALCFMQEEVPRGSLLLAIRQIPLPSLPAGLWELPKKNI